MCCQELPYSKLTKASRPNDIKTVGNNPLRKDCAIGKAFQGITACIARQRAESSFRPTIDSRLVLSLARFHTSDQRDMNKVQVQLSLGKSLAHSRTVHVKLRILVLDPGLSPWRTWLDLATAGE
jgi:hypothetical protein